VSLELLLAVVAVPVVLLDQLSRADMSQPWRPEEATVSVLSYTKGAGPRSRADEEAM
jgi:hypothetical protein